MKSDKKDDKKQGGRKKIQLYKPRKKKSVEEDAAIQYLQAQYEKINPSELKSFKDLPLSQKTLRGLKQNNYVTPTEIQKQAIGYALQGKDILGAAKTGSGKTLAFLIPMLESLFCKKWTRLDAVGALVISPTRELAYQIYETLRKVGLYHDFSAGLIIGGQNLKFERKRMDQINILICTPGRLLQHMDQNPLFNCSQLQILVLDEADRCLDMGFEETMNAIIEHLPPERQTLLFSATQTKSVKDLVRLSLKFPTYVAPHEQAATVTPESLQQSYIVCDVYEKIGILWSFIRNHLKQKVLVFMATCKQVKYVYELFCKLRPGVSLLALYGTLHQEKREKIYNEFCRKSNVVLFATDLASRGLDFPKVNWVIQMDCPEDVDTYIHRAGRTARGFFGKGEGLLMLLPQEEKFVEDLQNSKIPINKIAVDPSKVQAPQTKIEVLLNDGELKQSAKRAFMSYVRSIFLMKNKQIFNIQLLDIDAYAKSLGLRSPPHIKFLHKQQHAQSVEQDKDDAMGKPKQQRAQSIEQDKDDAIGKQKSTTESDVFDKDDFIRRSISSKCQERRFQPNGNDVDPENKAVNPRSRTNQDQNQESVPTMSQNIGQLLDNTSSVEALRKTFKLNKKVKFTDAEAVEDKKRGVEADFSKQVFNVDIPCYKFENVLQVLREEDKCDMQKFREKVRAKHKAEKFKLKKKRKEDQEEKDDFGSESESDGPDLSWLPDPDKVYGKSKDGSNSESETHAASDENSNSDNGSGSAASSGESSGDELDHNFHRNDKRKLEESERIPQESVGARKRRKVDDLSASLSVSEAEALAMQLLQAKR